MRIGCTFMQLFQQLVRVLLNLWACILETKILGELLSVIERTCLIIARGENYGQRNSCGTAPPLAVGLSYLKRLWLCILRERACDL